MPPSPQKPRVQQISALPLLSLTHVSFRSTLHPNEGASPSLKGKRIACSCSLTLSSASVAIRRLSWGRTRPTQYPIGWSTSTNVSPAPTVPFPTVPSPPIPTPSAVPLRTALSRRLRDAGVSRPLRFTSLFSYHNPQIELRAAHGGYTGHAESTPRQGQASQKLRTSLCRMYHLRGQYPFGRTGILSRQLGGAQD